MSIDILYIAIFSIVWCIILTDPEMILNWLYILLEKHLPVWLFKPIIGCSVCNSGQVSFWYYLLTTHEYNPVEHVFFTTTTIFLVYILITIINKINA